MLNIPDEKKIDFVSAYDIEWRMKLLGRLQYYAVNGIMLRWISMFINQGE
jgi:hypothetical protein